MLSNSINTEHKDENLSSQVENSLEDQFQKIVNEEFATKKKTNFATSEPVSATVLKPNSVPRPWKNPLRFLGWLIQNLFGIASLSFFLAVLAAIPVVNILALGFLLDAEGRVARTGKLSQGFPLFAPSKRLGGIAFGILFFIFPLQYLGGITSDSQILNPNSTSTHWLELLTVIAASGVFIHLLFALGRGGSLSYFFRPIKNIKWMVSQLKSKNYLENASASVREFVNRLRIVEHFKLGFFGAAGVLMWTFLPTLLYSLADSSKGPAVIVTIIGGILLTFVISWLPTLQAGFADKKTFSAYRELKNARRLFRKTPMLWTLAMLVGFALSLVLYLFKVVAPPQDALWMMTIVFVATIYPARLFIAWVYARSNRKETEPHFLWRWLWSFLCLDLCGLYVFLLFFTRNIGANGKLVLFEQPLLLIPSPF